MILSTRLYPTEHDKQVETKELDKLLQDLDEYLGEFIKCVTANRDKTKLELAAEAR